MSKGPFGIEDPRLYRPRMTADGKWMVGYVDDGKWVMDQPVLYDSMEQAEEVAEILTARDMDRYRKELATRPFTG